MEFWDKDEPPNHDEAIKLLRSCDGDEVKIRQWNKMRSRFPDWRPDLRGAKLPGIWLQRINLSAARLDDEADLRNAQLQGSHLRNARLCKANLRDAHLNGAQLGAAQLQGAELIETSLIDANLGGADLTQAILTGAHLEGTKMNDVNLRHANVVGVSMDTQTYLKANDLYDCTIDRYTAELLHAREQIGRGEIMMMNIEDGLAQLRYQYSGFLLWLHLVALACFVFPYAWFVVKQWGVARFYPDPTHSITLLHALARFIYNGGDCWKEGWSLAVAPCSAFAFALAYNVLRFVLLWKTKKLELRQEASGQPVQFSLTGKWLWWFQLAQRGFRLNLIAVACHTTYFFMQRVPIG